MRFLVVLFLFSASSFGQEGIPVDIGKGEFPPGLVGVSEIKAVQKSRIDAIEDCVDVLRSRFEVGIIDITLLLEAQMELATAQLETTHDKQERLEFIQQALVAALRTWRWVNESKKAGTIGADAEPRARAAVFRYRVMWLKEKAGDNNDNQPKAIQLP